MSVAKLVILIGYRGSGKTSVGKLLAQRLQWAWCDSDDAIEALAGQSIAEIFASHGEEHFRELETQSIQTLISTADQRGQIISLGGGAPMRECNRRLWSGKSTCVYLRGDAETLHRRISVDNASASRRPDLTDQGGLAEVKMVLAQRSEIYQQCADFVVDVDNQSPAKIADAIVRYNANLHKA